AQRAILRRLGAGESEVGGVDRLQQALKNSGKLLVLDDAANTDQVNEILGSHTRIPVIVTSRAPMSGTSDWAHVELSGLGARETATLLRTLTPASGHAVRIGRAHVYTPVTF